MTTVLRLVKLTCILVLAGCAAIGPTNSPQFQEMVQHAVPVLDGDVRLFGAGNWFPNTRGFTPLRSLSLARPTDPIPGVLVITGKAILFQQWDDNLKVFDVVKRLPLSDVVSVSLDSFGLSRRLVVRRTDLSYESFDFTKANGNFIDAPKVESAAALLGAEAVNRTN